MRDILKANSRNCGPMYTVVVVHQTTSTVLLTQNQTMIYITIISAVTVGRLRAEFHYDPNSIKSIYRGFVVQQNM